MAGDLGRTSSILTGAESEGVCGGGEGRGAVPSSCHCISPVVVGGGGWGGGDDGGMLMPLVTGDK